MAIISEGPNRSGNDQLDGRCRDFDAETQGDWRNSGRQHSGPGYVQLLVVWSRSRGATPETCLYILNCRELKLDSKSFLLYDAPGSNIPPPKS